MAWVPTLYYALAFVVGAAVGLAELLSRYNWTIRSILRSGSGWTYLGINGGAAVVGYRLAVDWNFNAGLAGRPEMWRVLAVSTLAMFFLRSSLASVKIGEQEVGVGLVSLIEIFLRRAEKVLDQAVSRDRWTRVASKIDQLSYDATKNHFVTVSEMLLQSLNEADRTAWHRELAKIEESDVDSETKMRLLAVCISDRVGDRLFETMASEAISQFGDTIRQEKGKRESDRLRLAQLRALISEQEM